ncbi:MAG: FAD-dependent oxidoreductase [SAR324 cluster bacterium]|nr:FAD-dependent oxidoreductase [SAR324 cluster bacterium]
MKYQIGSENRPLSVAIIGSGPSAFYAAGDLLNRTELNVQVDMFDRLPTPYGLVRGGVAPDHQRIKNVTKIYERIASLPQFRFWGNVNFGTDISREEILKHFDCIVYAVGAKSDRQMGIPGEQLIGSYSATEFVGWYNGHPDYLDAQFDFSVEKVAIIGMGNVAIDVARILAKTPEELASTDIADYALEALKNSRVKNIYVIGRRGPVQAAFTSPEAKEMLELEQTEVIVDPEVLKLDGASQRFLDTTKNRDTVRTMEILQRIAGTEPEGKPRQLHLMFQYSPLEIYGSNERVSGIKLVKNKLVEGEGGRIKAEETGIIEELPVGLVLRSIGYKGVALPGVSFDEREGIIPNHNGRVVDERTKEICSREYVVGWAKRGPTGVIGTNKPDAIETTQHLLEDFRGQTAEAPEELKRESIEAWLKSKKIEYVTFEGWKRLDQHEIDEGAKKGKPRQKTTKIEDMLKIIK